MPRKVGNKYRKGYNFGLPKGFRLDYTVLSVDQPYSESRKRPVTRNPVQSMMKYLHSKDNVDYGMWAQEVYLLPKRPLRHRLSIYVFSVIRERDEQWIQETYPERYVPEEEKGSLAEAGLIWLFKRHRRGLITWCDEIESGIKKHFNARLYAKFKNPQPPFPVLIIYGWCGPYENHLIEFHDKREKLRCCQHTPWQKNCYHSVLMYQPVRLNVDFGIKETFNSLVTSANKYVQQPLLSVKELVDLWAHVQSFILPLPTRPSQKHLAREDLMGTHRAKIKRYLNTRIKKYGRKQSVANDFYLRHCIDFLDFMSYLEVLGRCLVCNMTLDYEKRGDYCSEKCERKFYMDKYYVKHRNKILQRSKAFKEKLKQDPQIQAINARLQQRRMEERQVAKK